MNMRVFSTETDTFTNQPKGRGVENHLGESPLHFVYLQPTLVCSVLQLQTLQPTVIEIVRKHGKRHGTNLGFTYPCGVQSTPKGQLWTSPN